MINWIRGYDQADIAGYTATGLRTRTLDNGNVWKLGDIVNSTPVSVGKTPDNFHIIYGDSTFQTYYDSVRDRETVVYVGSNDGMLHAFTSWHYDSTNGLYDDPYPADGPGNSSYIPGERIGDELWAYIPQTLLPHLKWLANPEYNHAYFVDLKPKIFDALIDVDGDTAAEWRTLLICGLNLGGKHIWATDDFDGNAGNETRHFYPAYFCIDITEPRAPRVLWERSFEGLGMTTSSPAVVKIGDSWFAIIGSGPNDDDGTDDIVSGLSDQNGHIFVLDILTGQPYNNGVDEWLFETTESNAYMSAASSIDYGLTNNVDGIYIASSYQDGSSIWRGNIYKINTWSGNSPSEVPSNWSSSILYDGSDAGPITSGVSLSVDSEGNVWTYFGTGRYLSFADKVDQEQQYFFGMKDPFFNLDHDQSAPNDFYLNPANARTLVSNNLFNSDGYTVTTERNVYTGSCPPTCNPFGTNGTWDEFVTEVRNWDGWYISLETTAGLPSERVVSKASILGGIVFFPGYTPNDDVCGFGGDSSFYGLYFETGTAFPKIVLPGGYVDTSIDGESATIVSTRIDLGSGAPPPATGFHVGQQEGAKAFLQMSTGQVIELDVETAFRLKSGLTYWRERL